MMETDREALLQLPCHFPIKVMGLASAQFEQTIVEIVQRHAPELTLDSVRGRHSRGGKYLALTVTIVAQSREQLDAIYRELTACQQVMLAL